MKWGHIYEWNGNRGRSRVYMLHKRKISEPIRSPWSDIPNYLLVRFVKYLKWYMWLCTSSPSILAMSTYCAEDALICFQHPRILPDLTSSYGAENARSTQSKSPIVPYINVVDEFDLIFLVLCVSIHQIVTCNEEFTNVELRLFWSG